MTGWNDLPGETRNNIYRHLLVDKGYVLKPLGKNRANNDAESEDTSYMKHLGISILGVNSSIHKEAISILYEENTFRFEYPHRCVKHAPEPGRGFSMPQTPFKDFNKIKKLEISWGPEAPQHICQDAEEILAVVNHVATFGCSLDMLWVTFTFITADEDMAIENLYDDGRVIDPAMIIAKSGTLMAALASLVVSQQFKIVINSDRLGDCSEFEKFVNQIAFLKRWAVTVMKDELDKDFLYMDSEEEPSQNEGSTDLGCDLEVNTHKGTNQQPVGADERYHVQSEQEDDEVALSDESSHHDDLYSDEYDDSLSEDDEDPENDNNDSETDDDDQSDISEDEQVEMLHTWTWTLRPATEATKGLVPQSGYPQLPEGA